jgi:NADP-dependent aldehyde dehydrogenase
MATELDMENEKSLMNMMPEVAGRIVMNGAPTGVEVCYAMQHGGSFPASTDGKYTSVGQDAIKRFVKPVAYQNFPQSLLPDELKDENPLGIMRIVNQEYTRQKI